MRARIALLSLLAVICLAGWAQAGQHAATQASHTFATVPPPDGYGFNWLHRDLELNGDHHLIFSLCGSPVPAAWLTGVEAWGNALPLWDFELILCTRGNTNLQWDLELPQNRCPLNAVACWKPVELGSHGGHKDLAYADIYFNFGLYDPRPPAEEKSIAAHEWGHTMSLEDPDPPESQCDHGSIMGYDPICFFGPTATDVMSVRCDVYNQCQDSPGVFRGGTWYLNNQLDSGPSEHQFTYGLSTDRPVAGDWNGDGASSVGVYRAEGNNGRWFLNDQLDSSVSEHSFIYGLSTDAPVVGDWNGDGIDTVGVFRNGTWYLNNGFDCCSEHQFAYGLATDKPVAGDWNGDGIDTVGVYRAEGTNGRWFLNDQLDSSVSEYSFIYGLSTDVPVSGDWNADGIDTVGVYRNVSGAGEWFLNDGFDGASEHSFIYGLSTDKPVPGDWNGQ